MAPLAAVAPLPRMAPMLGEAERSMHARATAVGWVLAWMLPVRVSSAQLQGQHRQAGRVVARCRCRIYKHG
jgi:hypothetical protein